MRDRGSVHKIVDIITIAIVMIVVTVVRNILLPVYISTLFFLASIPLIDIYFIKIDRRVDPLQTPIGIRLASLYYSFCNRLLTVILPPVIVVLLLLAEWAIYHSPIIALPFILSTLDIVLDGNILLLPLSALYTAVTSRQVQILSIAEKDSEGRIAQVRIVASYSEKINRILVKIWTISSIELLPTLIFLDGNAKIEKIDKRVIAAEYTVPLTERRRITSICYADLTIYLLTVRDELYKIDLKMRMVERDGRYIGKTCLRFQL